MKRKKKKDSRDRGPSSAFIPPLLSSLLCFQLVHDHVLKVLEAQCHPNRTRERLFPQPPPSGHMTQPFLWKDAPLPDDLFLYPPPFGFQGLQSKVEELLKQVTTSSHVPPLWGQVPADRTSYWATGGGEREPKV